MKEFGHNIAFNYTEFRKPDTGIAGRRNSSGYDSLSDDEGGRDGSQKSELISGLLRDANSTPVPSLPPTEVAGPAVEPAVAVPEGRYTRGWLKSQCQSYSKDSSTGGLNWQELYSAIFDLLSSSEDNSGIENNVSVTAFE